MSYLDSINRAKQRSDERRQQQQQFVGKKETLDDLESDEYFQSVSERFLTSVGENPDDIFEYLRDSDFNLYSGMRRAMQSGKFTEQQKQDYKYLRSRFDNADMGSLKQYFELIKDASVDLVTDPTLITAALLTPVTGGVSLAARQGLSQGALKVASNVTKANLKDIGKKQIRKATAVTAAEGGAWVGLENHFRQNTELNTDIRKMYSTPELVGSTALGALTGAIFGNLAQRSSTSYSKLNRLYSNDEYRKTAGSESMYFLKRLKDKALSITVGKASAILRTYSEFSPTAKKLGQKFDDSFERRFTQLSTKRADYSYGEDLDFTRGQYIAARDIALAPIIKEGKILPEEEIQVIRILRGDDPSKYSKEVQESASKYRELFFNRIIVDATEAGLEPHAIPNYFTRSWNRKAIEDDTDGFRQKLLDEKVDGVTEENVDEVISEMLNKQNELFANHAHLLTQSRAFKNLDDNSFEKYLNNDLVEVTTDYAFNSAKIIEEQKSFLLTGKSRVVDEPNSGSLEAFRGDAEKQFTKRYINEIDKELKEVRGKGLSRGEKKDILNLYKSVTGKVQYFDSGLAQGVYDGMKLANAVAYLPLATVSSLTEAFIPLTKAKPSSAVKGALDGIKNGVKILTDETAELVGKKYNLSENEIRKEMRSVMIAVDESMSDMTNRLAGEGMQSKFFQKAARGFYRLNLLTPWTKTIELSSFSTGKDLIFNNLTKLRELADEGVDVFSDIADLKIQRLRSELFDLGVDVRAGITWLREGALKSSRFYENDVVRGAGRFTRDVILPTSRERAKVPTYMTNPKFDILTQFLRYPFAFSNTVLKNFARDTITNPLSNAPKLAAFTVAATGVAVATNYLRAGEEEAEEMFDEDNMNTTIMRAFQRVGLLGPLENGLRYGDAIREGKQNPIAAGTAIAGPVVSDTVRVLTSGRLLETLARKTPGIGLKGVIEKNLGDTLEEYTGMRSPYNAAIESAREADNNLLEAIKDLFGAGRNPKELMPSAFESSMRSAYFQGGSVERNVSDVKQEPENRIDPFTGEPYAAQSPIVAKSILREYEQEKMFERKTMSDFLESREQARVPVKEGGMLQTLQKREKFIVGGPALAAKAILKLLPKTVYRGGTSRIVTSPEGTESVFAASVLDSARDYARRDALPKVYLTDGESLKIPQEAFGVHAIDISKAKKPYVLDKPSVEMKAQIEKDLMALDLDDYSEETESLSSALLSLLEPEQNDLRVASSSFYPVNRAIGKYLREKGFDIAVDSKTLKEGFENNPAAELFILKKFPVKRLDDVAPDDISTTTEIATTKALAKEENVAKKVDEPPLTKQEKFQLKEKERTEKPIDDTLPAYKFFNLKDKDVMAWRDKTKAEVKIKENDTGLPQKRKQIPELANAAEDLSRNKISVDEYRNEVIKLMPIVPFKQVPEMTPLIDVIRSLNAGKIKEGVGVIGADIPKLSTGTEVGLRLDIPSYNFYDTWVVSIHEGLGTSGKSRAYSNTGWITDVIFNTKPETAYNIAIGNSKTTFARANGLWKDHTADEAFKKAQQYMDDPEWSQIGMNPYRFSYFYDKADGMPVVNADEVIQIGPLVLGKNVTKAKPTDKRFEIDLKDGRIFNFSTGGNVKTPAEPEEFLIYKLLQDDESSDDVRFAFRKGGGLLGKLQSRKANV